jgi:hypothetical protein
MKFSGAQEFPLVMISAMYENGGNTTHRILDGHPELFVYPFESQLGSRHVQDCWSAMYPAKYRWPEFLLSASLEQDYAAIIDEEAKVRSRTPFVSKFREWDFDFSDEDRKQLFVEMLQGLPRTRANSVCGFMAATFEAWRDHKSSGKEHVYVGYSPVFGIDSEKFLADVPQGHILHVVRNPWSAYADTKRRAVPLGVAHYMNGWVSLQLAVMAAREIWPERVHLVRFEDVIAGAVPALTAFCQATGIDPAALVAYPTWNGQKLDEVYPWGTVRKATEAENLERAQEVSADDTRSIERLTRPLLEPLGYAEFLDTLKAAVR